MSKIINLTDDAYQLPVDTVYFIQDAQNSELFNVAEKYINDIQTTIDRRINTTIYNYRIKLIKYNPEDPKLTSLYPHHKIGKQPDNKPTLPNRQNDIGYNIVAHIVPSSLTDQDNIRLLTDNICTEDYQQLTEEFIKFIYLLDQHNRHALQQGDIRHQYKALKQSDDEENLDIDDEDILEAPIYTYSEIPQPRLQFSISEKRLFACPAMPCKKSAPTKKSEEQDTDHETYELAQQIKRAIDSLQRKNGINILSEILSGQYLFQELKNNHPQPSTIVIDDKFRILLPEYDCEIKCPKLSTAVYILFLRHPEGIRLKEIENYKDELSRIYFIISPRSNLMAQYKSIQDLTDPASGSLNQKISRISAAFREHLNSESTQPYIITGERGEKHSIHLAKEMISLPTELLF